MKKIGRIRKFYNKLEAMSNTGKAVFVFSLLLSMQMCSQAGWVGYYQTYPKTNLDKVVFGKVLNGVAVEQKNGEKLYVGLPEGCSSFRLAGIITPFTPPIPIPNFRAISFGKNDPCNFFIVESKLDATIKLKLDNGQIYDSKTSEGSYNYTRHTFPIKSKNLDSGILIIEKDGEVTEVPFEYKYQKFWH